MELIKAFDYEGTSVSFNQEDGVFFVNSTEIAKPFEKKPSAWLRLPSTIAFLAVFTEVGKSHVCDPVRVTRGKFQKESPLGSVVV